MRHPGISLRLIGLFAILSPLHADSTNTPYTIDTVAGSSWVGDGGSATSAILFQAEGLASDANGNFYIADSADHRVRLVTAAGTIRTVAGTGSRGFSGDGGPAASAQLNSPYGLACDAYGNLYIADLGNSRVRKVGPDGTITTVAGGGALPAGGANEGSAAVLLALSGPRNLALDNGGGLFISDFTGQRVYRLGADGTLITVAGTGVAGNSGDGAAATHAQVAFPAGLALDRQGSLHIADSGNHLVRKVLNGVISSVAHSATPTGVAFDNFGALYIADPSAGQVVKIGPGSGATTVVLSFSANDLAFTIDGSLLASSAITSSGSEILRISPSAVVNIAAGGGNPAYGDGGDAEQARLNHPSGVAMDSSGNLYIADRNNNRIRRVGTDGVITTIAGTGASGNLGDGAAATQSQLSAPSSVSVDAAGNLYIADTGNQRIRKVTPDGRILAAASVGLVSPVYAIADAAGNLYIADAGAGKILKAGSNGVLASLANGLASPRGLALDQQGNIYFTEASGARVSRLAPDGTLAILGKGSWSIPRGVAVDSAGNVFVADTGLQQILRMDSSGQVTPVAGTGTSGFSGEGGPALAAQLGYPWDVGVGPAGGLVIAELDANRVRSLTPAAQAPANLTQGADAVNAASLMPGPVAPGMLLLLRGTGLAAAQMNDTQVLFGAAAARILSADGSGILLVSPQEIAGSGAVNINVLYQGASVATIPVAVTDSAPALFAGATGQAAATNLDGTVNSQNNPAARGSAVSLYGTGLGISGATASVTFAGYDAQVLYAGPVVEYPGLFQINAVVPIGYLTATDLTVVVSIGPTSSQAGVMVWVR